MPNNCAHNSQYEKDWSSSSLLLICTEVLIYSSTLIIIPSSKSKLNSQFTSPFSKISLYLICDESNTWSGSNVWFCTQNSVNIKARPFLLQSQTKFLFVGSCQVNKQLPKLAFNNLKGYRHHKDTIPPLELAKKVLVHIIPHNKLSCHTSYSPRCPLERQSALSPRNVGVRSHLPKKVGDCEVMSALSRCINKVSYWCGLAMDGKACRAAVVFSRDY